MSLSWYGADFVNMVDAELARRFAKAGVFFTSKLRGFLNRSQPYHRTPSGGTVGLDPSLPGEYPKKLTGQLQRSITWTVTKKPLVLTVGSNLKGHPKYLQLGTTLMKPRPWLTLGFDGTKDQMGRIIAGGK
jgi:hypothetical protein